MKKRFYILLILMCINAGFVFAAHEDGLIKRTILVLFDSTETEKPELTLTHTKAEVILNHLGYILDYKDITKGLPDADYMEGVHGILTWFQDSKMSKPAVYLDWLEQQIENGKKVVIIGELGASSDRHGNYLSEETINRFYANFGVKSEGNETENPFLIDIAYKDTQMMEFERSVDMELNYYIQLKKISSDLKSYLVLERTDIPDSESQMVFTCTAGGMAAIGYALFYDEETFKTQWRVNPFIFFKEAFGYSGYPVPDISTYNGSRMLFVHIDGDALISVSLVEPNKLCGEVVLEQIFEKYKVPTSASIIPGEIIIGAELPWIKNKKDLKDIVKRMYEIPYIEPAAHGFTHPLHWEKNITAIALPPYSKNITAEEQKILEETVYDHLTMDMAYITAPFEEMARKETLDALKYINENILEDSYKEAKLFFWTGNCSPQPEVVKLCNENGVLNINGGDPIFDAEFNSYSHLCPIRRAIGDAEQFYTAACNENIFTNLWTGPYYGFKNVIEHFKRTESPIRIKPANIYYHFYSGERISSLKALSEIYDYVVDEQYMRIYASEYLKIASDWFATKIYEVQKGKEYRIINQGICRTVRFDNCDEYVDLAESQGVIGFLHYQGSLYVHLDKSGTAQIRLTDVQPQTPYLMKSNARINNWKVDLNQITCRVSAVGEVFVKIANAGTAKIHKVMFDNKQVEYNFDENGVLTVNLPEEPVVKNNMVLTITSE